MSGTMGNQTPAWGDPAFTDGEKATLAALCARMIPASAEFNVPGADDPPIQADILASLGRDAANVHATLAMLDRLSGGSFVALPEDQRDQVCERLRAEGGVDLTLTSRLIVQCYYRDDRVMISLGMEPRPPFPKGHTLPQGDWALLDQVRNRGKIWRET